MFKVGDRVRISSNAPAFPNLAGREGTVAELLDGTVMLGPAMISVKLDNIYSVPVVPFYENELILIKE